MDSHNSGIVARRQLLRGTGLSILAVSLAACASPAASPTGAPKPPAAQPTAAATASKPAPATPAPPTAVAKPTQAPPKPQTLQKARVGLIAGLAEYAFTRIGIDRGIYREEGIDVEFVDLDSGATQTKAMLAGELDTAHLGVTALFPAIEQGAELKIVGGSFVGINYVMFARPGIARVEDLPGKSVGTGAPGSFVHVIANTLLKERGVDTSSVEFINIGTTPAVFAALQAGKVDAGPGTVDFIPRAEASKNPVVIADFTKEIPNYMRGAMTVSDKLIKDKPAYVQSMLNAITRSHRHGLDNRAELVQYGVEKMAKDKPGVEAMWDFYVKTRLIAADAEIDPKKVEYTQQINVDNQGQRAILPFERTAVLDFHKAFVAKYGSYQYK